MNKKLNIAVVGGAGHVGLPLSLLLQYKGFQTTVIDIDAEKIERIKQGEFPFMEKGGAALLKTVKDKVTFTTEHKQIKNCDVVILTIGTPVDKHLNPVLGAVYDTIDQIQPYLKDSQVIILRSTLFPGTSNMICEKLSAAGLKVGVCFCPERIAQGNALEELQVFPQIISGVDSRSLSVARHIFSTITEQVIELEMIEAELAKLFTNAWRYIRFSVANQFYMMVEEKGLDFYKIREAMIKDYPRAADFPTAGFAAGPCLFKDTMQLAAFNRQNFPLGNAAMLVNETLPDFLVDQAKLKFDLKGKRVGILGMAFKADNDDYRESLAYKLRRRLQQEHAEVLCTDPYIKDPSFKPLKEVLDSCNLIFIGCPHSEYRQLNLEGRDTIDCWNITRPKEEDAKLICEEKR